MLIIIILTNLRTNMLDKSLTKKKLPLGENQNNQLQVHMGASGNHRTSIIVQNVATNTKSGFKFKVVNGMLNISLAILSRLTNLL